MRDKLDLDTMKPVATLMAVSVVIMLATFGCRTRLRQQQEVTTPPLPPLHRAVPSSTKSFAAVAVDENGLSSAFSNIVTTNATNFVTLTWAKSPSTNVIADYRIFWGPGTGTNSMTNIVRAGTGLSVTVSVAPPAKTNRLVAATPMSAPGPTGPWRPILGGQALYFTNSTTNLYLRYGLTNSTF